tara:strand:- start:4722 stop:5066 length:345 start_codon:yes stop_codon:yes gene_type:complete
MKSERKTIKSTFTGIELDYKTLDNAIDYLSGLRACAEEDGYDAKSLMIEERYSWDDEVSSIITGYRLETDKEYEARVKWETRRLSEAKEIKAKKEANELATYKRLQKKFGKGVK